MSPKQPSSLFYSPSPSLPPSLPRSLAPSLRLSIIHQSSINQSSIHPIILQFIRPSVCPFIQLIWSKRTILQSPLPPFPPPLPSLSPPLPPLPHLPDLSLPPPLPPLPPLPPPLPLPPLPHPPLPLLLPLPPPLPLLPLPPPPPSPLPALPPPPPLACPFHLVKFDSCNNLWSSIHFTICNHTAYCQFQKWIKNML